VALATCSEIAIDTETNGEDIRDGRGYALGISVAFVDGSGKLTAFYLPFRHSNLGGGVNYNLVRFLPVLQEILDTRLLVYHNAKFDIVSLRSLGLQTGNPAQRFVDTMVLAHLLDENRPFTGKSLDSCARYYLKDEGGKRKSDNLKQAIKLVGWGMLTPGLISKYAMYDAVLTLRLWIRLQPLLKAEGLGVVWPHKKRFLELLIEMEGYGVHVDTDLCTRMSAIGRRKMADLQSVLGANPASPKDLERLILDDLGLPEVISPKTGRRTFDKDAMKWYETLMEEMGSPLAQQILTFRGWQKSCSSNYESYLSHLSPDGQLRPNYLMHGTITGRLSCREPNLQQIPKLGTKPWNGQMKACFVSRPGYALISVDYSQLELRLATVYAQEPELVTTFNEGRDIFTEMSEQLGMNRNDTKTFVYSTQYGAGLKRISTVFGISPTEAASIRQRYYETYPLFRAASDKAAHFVTDYSKIRLWSGRYRHFLYPEEDSHKAFNSLCQGGGADIVERAMVRLSDDGFNDGEECRILLQIHDEAVVEIRQDKVKEYSAAIADSMANVNFHPRLSSVKFAADAKPWGSK
jgi:DNA polymerase-1